MLTLSLLLTGIAQGRAAELRSPWDMPVSVQKRDAFTCPSPPELPNTIKAADYYTDAAHSIVDPVRKKAYDEATGGLRSAMRDVIDMADRYQADGDEMSARCAAHFLDSFAANSALTGDTTTNQAVYVQGWTLGSFAIAWLKIRSDSDISAKERSRITASLADVASRNIDYYKKRDDKSDGRNNHRYWAGFTAMAAGIAADRKDLFDWGVGSFKIGARQVQPDGTMPLEMERRSRALHYHIFAAAPLVTMAELASANDIDLYAANDNALSRLVRLIVAGIDDPSLFATKAGTAQEAMHLHADDIAWATPFERRFPNSELAALLKKLTAHSMPYLGGMPPV
ncbi:alginate lyase family protein [Rhizobium lusitanum]|uniref:Poly(Beta-D-mannuronate) lyase n=1 Tax=Rhizobium lusitanum TaxID=293958 RepID=A0A7X0IV91_9HYPH|nr:alginate lyase family protein [Rhizobium lusitanum]MBB6487363.1 poly(beta-D-mannuronate) lyase [Rhizobium lusitanum]